MKPKENNLEKNISRLVKLAGDADKPSGAFVDSVMEDALDELKTPGAGAKREKKDKSAKSKSRKIFAYAAAVIFVSGVVVALTLPSLNRVRRHARKVAWSDEIIDGDSGPRTEKRFKLEAEKSKVAERSKKGRIVVVEPSDKSSIALYNEASKDLESDIRYVEVKKKYGVVALGTRKSGAEGSSIRFGKPERGSGGYPMAHGGSTPPNGEDVDGMFFKNYGVNPFVDTEDDHLSTFATDVDTGSYTVVRRYLHDGHLPPEKAVRVEEFVNYFNYRYAAPQEEDFAVYAEAAPWRFGTGRKNSYLLRLGLKGKQVSEESRKPAILTFVIDVSGSMKRENRLGLVKRSLRMLIERLREEDRIGIAVYGSRGRKVMDHRGLYDKAEILATIESLGASGSTFAEEGIRIGYEMAENAYRRGYINRVILCSDGVANVGQTGADDILEVIKQKAEKGITLSAIGFGMGNYNDVLLETLGDKGNGHYVYIDTIAEARRVFEDNLTGTLQVIARDVKIQVDFNPEVVRSYRLIGYENRDVPD
ncbi:MAG: vWA domain-containing protein, partial [Planctomycetota bacterium]